MLEIKELAKLKMRLMGVEYELTKPTSRQAKAVSESMSTEEGKLNAFDTLEKFLIEAGLPADVAGALQLEHLQLIFEHLMGAKKN